MTQSPSNEQFQHVLNVVQSLIDFRRAEIQAHRLVLRALLKTHPNPDALHKAIGVDRERWTAQVLSSEWPDDLIERIESELRFLLAGTTRPTSD
jgi:hypothetical protein